MEINHNLSLSSSLWTQETSKTYKTYEIYETYETYENAYRSQWFLRKLLKIFQLIHSKITSLYLNDTVSTSGLFFFFPLL